MGVLYSMPVSDAVAFVASVVIIVQTDRQLKREIAAGREKA